MPKNRSFYLSLVHGHRIAPVGAVYPFIGADRFPWQSFLHALVAILSLQEKQNLFISLSDKQGAPAGMWFSQA